MTDELWHDPSDPRVPHEEHDPFDGVASALSERVRPWWEPATATVSHLVFVDGRLVEVWQEPATGTRWQQYAGAPPPPPPPPPPSPPPLHRQVRDWLVDVCGSPDAVDGLTGDRLPPCDLAGSAPPGVPECRERVLAAAELLDDLADRFFEPEVADAYRHALLALWREDPLTITRPVSTAALAGGLAWAVGKANGLYQPTGFVRVGTIQDAFDLPSAAASAGRPVAAALRGFRGRSADAWRAPAGLPDLLRLGRTDVLVGAIRQQLIRIRDRAAASAGSAA